MEDVKTLVIILEGVDIRDPEQEEIATEKFKEEMQKHGYFPTDNVIVLRDKKMTSIRALQENDEEAEMYAYSQVKEENGKPKTVVMLKIV